MSLVSEPQERKVMERRAKRFQMTALRFYADRDLAAAHCVLKLAPQANSAAVDGIGKRHTERRLDVPLAQSPKINTSISTRLFRRTAFKKGFKVKNNLYYLVSVVLVGLVGLSGLSSGQRRATNSTTRPASSLLATLPASDAVALIKVTRVLDEALPKLLSANPAKLAEVNSQIEKFKTTTGLDPRSFDEVALGFHYSYPSTGITKIETIGLGRGSFNAGAIAAAGRVATSGKYREEKYQGRTVHIFALDQHVKLLGLLNIRIRELAVSPIDRTTLALGDLKRVRRAIDAAKGNARGNAELIALATQDKNAIIGFGGNISPAVIQNLSIGNDAIAQELSTVRQIFGSVGMTDKDLEVLLAARTMNADSARSLSETVEGLKQFGALFINQLSASKGALARSALANLRITTQGNELLIRTAVSQADVAPLMRGF